MTKHRIVDAAADVLSKRLDRRGFLGRAAVAGTALAVNPAAYVLQPVSAYAAICTCSGQSCDCGSRCCDGYTEFCCTITGRNSCPPGTLTAGWWKVEGSNFCGGGPRFYMDCNAGCGSCGCGASGVCGGGCSGTTCGCANGSCGNRKAGCTLFRYGQCNQAVACVGPIVCRVVSCVPPWQLDATCTTSPRTDENTRFHDAPCLHQVDDPNKPFGNIDAAYAVSGGITVQGWAIDPDTTGPIEVHVYVDGGFAGFGYANQNRPDLTSLGYGPGHGFSITVAAGEGAHQVCVYAINVVSSTQNPQLGCRTVQVGGPPFGNIDSVRTGPGTVTVQGWAIDADAPSTAIEVHAYVDGAYAGFTRAGQHRADLAGLGHGTNHGFTLQLTASEGSHQVCVYAINVGSSPVNPSLGCRTFTVGGPPIGNIDSASASQGVVTVSGWALDPDTTAPVEVHAYVDGRFAAYGAANRNRPDVGSTFPGYGSAHGFELSFAVGSGAHDVCVYAINVGAARVNPSLGCRRVTA